MNKYWKNFENFWQYFQTHDLESCWHRVSDNVMLKIITMMTIFRWTWMLVTGRCWWFNINYNFWLLVSEFRKRLPTSQNWSQYFFVSNICHSHRCSLLRFMWQTHYVGARPYNTRVENQPFSIFLRLNMFIHHGDPSS